MSRSARTARMHGIGTAVGLTGVVSLSLLSGCGQPLREGQAAVRAGSPERAVKLLRPAAEKNLDGADSLLLWLELGSALHHAGLYEESTEAFRVAETRARFLDTRPETNAADETRGALTNPGEMMYRGTGYDRIMAPTLRGLNALLDGDLETPRQAFVEAGFQTDDALEKRAKRIERVERERDEASAEEGMRIAPGATAEIDRNYSDLERFAPYADYAVPFGEWLRAVYLLAQRTDGADLDRARTLLRRVGGMVPDSEAVAHDLEDAEALLAGGSIEPLTHVVFATGFAPMRRSDELNLPLFLVNDRVLYFGLALPELEFSREYERSISIAADGVRAGTTLLTDMDRVVAADFEAERPVIVARAITSALVKAGAAYGIREATEGSDWALIVGQILAVAYQVWQNQADLRTWSTLPKQYQYARVPTPASGVVELTGGAGRSMEVRVEPGSVSLIYVRSTAPGRPWLVATAELRSAESTKEGQEHGA